MCSRRPAGSMPPHSSPTTSRRHHLDHHPALDPRRRLCGHGHAHAGHRGRQHRAVRHRRRPQHGPLGPAVGRRRLHARARRGRADRRFAGRPLRSSPALHHRSFDLHRHVARVCGGDGHRDAQLRARRPGRRRGDHVRRLARAARAGVPERAGARQGVRRLRRLDRRRLRHRPARRRRAHQRPRLALDLPRQPAARPHLPGDHAPLRRGVQGPQRPQARHARPAHADRRPVPARARAAARQRGRLDERADRGRAGRRRRLPRRVHRRRGARQGADAPARAVPQPRLHRRAGRGVRHLRVVLRRVPLHDDLPAADPRAVGDRGRPRLPAGHADHARRLRRDREPRREARRRAPGRRRPRARRHRPGAADDRRGRLVVGGVPPRRDRRLHRQRALQPGPQRRRARAPPRRR